VEMYTNAQKYLNILGLNVSLTKLKDSHLKQINSKFS